MVCSRKLYSILQCCKASMNKPEHKPSAPAQEKVAYERLIKECVNTQTNENNTVYNYLRSRRSTSSLALTEHLYEHRGDVK